MIPPGGAEAIGSSGAEADNSIGTVSGSCKVGSYRFLYIKCMAMKNIVFEKMVSLFGLERSHTFAQSPFSRFVFTITYYISESLREPLLSVSNMFIILVYITLSSAVTNHLEAFCA